MSEAGDTELEELLPHERHRGVPLAALAALALTFGLIGAALVSGNHGLSSKGLHFLSLVLPPPGRAVSLKEELQDCFEEGMYYASPATLPEQARSVEFTPERCQQRCQGVLTCEHFTFWPDGGCQLTGLASSLVPAPSKFSTTITGPKYCQKALEQAKAEIGNARIEASGTAGSWGASTYAALEMNKAAIQEINRDVKDVALAAAADALPVESGVNGSSCAKYPACIAAGMVEQECCPNTERLMLSCCAGFPKVKKKVVKVPPAANCSHFPRCRALNLSGACCPVQSGENLGCCFSAPANSSFWKTVTLQPTLPPLPTP